MALVEPFGLYRYYTSICVIGVKGCLISEQLISEYLLVSPSWCGVLDTLISSVCVYIVVVFIPTFVYD